MTVKLRPWQEDALKKAMNWLTKIGNNKNFLINAAPGAGKTICASRIALELLEGEHIDRVIVVAPRAEVVNQWAADFKMITGRFMGKVTASDDQFEEMDIDVCATWQALQGMADALQHTCEMHRVLVICDEHHHAAVDATWGKSADSAFKNAQFTLILTGTPIRSDGDDSIWLAYDDEGAINHPEEGTYTLTYGEAVDLEYCRPVAFHRHKGKFTVDLEGGEKIEVSGYQPAVLDKEMKRIPGLQAALDFYTLACTPQYEKDEKTPSSEAYHASMIEWATNKLDNLRLRMPEAGGLVIAPTIKMAEFICDLMEMMEGERPALVHSKTKNSEGRIEAFRNTKKRWIVSVAMISEGVDIPRLRLLIYLPNPLTELAFRQAIGRVVRTNGPEDDTRAYVIMPAFETFDMFAKKIESEMSSRAKAKDYEPKTKRCPACGEENELAASTCKTCDYEFPKPTSNAFKTCPACQALNPVGLDECQECGEQFKTDFRLTLHEALRDGVITRGMNLDENEVQAGEAIAETVRSNILQSGDEKLIKIIKTLPEESWERMKQIFIDSEDEESSS